MKAVPSESLRAEKEFRFPPARDQQRIIECRPTQPLPRRAPTG